MWSGNAERDPELFRFLIPSVAPSAVNKWDLVKDDGRGEAAVEELSDLLGCDPSEILRISAKTGWGVESVLEAIVERIPPPPPTTAAPKEDLRALAFDSWYDSFRGVVSLVSIHEGELRKGEWSCFGGTILEAFVSDRSPCYFN